MLSGNLNHLKFKPVRGESGLTYATVDFLADDGLVDADYDSQLTIDGLPNSMPMPIEQKMWPQPKPIMIGKEPPPHLAR